MWEISLNGQIGAFLYSLALGAVLALFYDLIRAIRNACFNSFIALFTGDLLFFIISAFAVFIFFTGVTNGEIRGYILFSTAVGFFICRFTLGKAFHFLIYRLLSFCSFAFKRLASFLFKITEFCVIPLKFILRGISTAGGYIFAVLKKLLKSIYNMLYTIKDKEKLRYNADGQKR